jgi:hypothetical protein
MRHPLSATGHSTDFDEQPRPCRAMMCLIRRGLGHPLMSGDGPPGRERDLMSTTFASAVPQTVDHAHASRRRGFEIVSRLARQNEPTGRRSAARSDASRRSIEARTDYEPRHRLDASTSFLMQQSAS